MKDNDNELDLNSPEFVTSLYRYIDKRIANAVDNLTFDSSVSATIIAVGSGVADIRFQGGTITIPNVKNKTGVALVVGDEVIVEKINNSLNNLVIKYKK